MEEATRSRTLRDAYRPGSLPGMTTGSRDQWTTSAGPLLRRRRRRLRPRPPVVPAEAARVARRPDADDRPRARRRHRQAHRASWSPWATTSSPPSPTSAMLDVLRADVPEVPHRRSPPPRRSRRPTGRSTSSSPRRPSTGSTTTRALPEIARVLKPGGHLALVVELPRRAHPVGAQARRLIGNQRAARRRHAAARAVRACSGTSRTRRSRYWQDVDRETLRRHRRCRAPTSPRSTTPRGRPGSTRCCAVRRLRPRPRRHAAALRHRAASGARSTTGRQSEPRRADHRRTAATTREPASPTAPTPTCCSSTSDVARRPPALDSGHRRVTPRPGRLRRTTSAPRPTAPRSAPCTPPRWPRRRCARG